MAYSRFVQWIRRHHGRNNRNNCVVMKIRQTFPSEQYCGFKYAQVYEGYAFYTILIES
jgi:hypothetical protein